MKRLTCSFTFALAAILAAALPAAMPASAQQPDPGPVHEFERLLHGYGQLRPPRDNDQASPRAANFDEAKTGNLIAPPLLARPQDASKDGWTQRRNQIAALIQDNWTGHIPEAANDLKIVWTRQPAGQTGGAYDVEQWIGQLVAPDGRMGPVIDATLTLPKNAEKVPLLVEYSFIWPPGFRFSGPAHASEKDMALKRGWGHVAYRPTLLQADTAATMEQGLIGLARWPREKHDWGALRAWGWGASKLREQLSLDPRIDGHKITLAGHSRFGKAVLVASAFDHQFANALVSSSGAGGAKLMRRDFGEHWTNMAGSYAYHWYTPHVMEFAGNQPLDALPVDAHMLIALRAPRPLLISAGLPEKGDDWVDPHGMWISTRLARPAWAAYGKEVFSGDAMPPVQIGKLETPLGFYQHDQGHVMWPAIEAFLDHAERNWAPLGQGE